MRLAAAIQTLRAPVIPDLYMKHRFLSSFSTLLAAACLVGLGCHRQNDGPPPPLPVEQIPAAFAAGFKDAKPEVKDLEDKFLKALEAKDYPAAHQAAQDLEMSPGATQPQQILAARAFLTMTSLLQTAQAQGDENAAAEINRYKSTK